MHFPVLQVATQIFLYLAHGVNIFMFPEKSDNLLRLFQPQRIFLALLIGHNEFRKIGKIQNAEENAVLLILPLQGGANSS